jgi:hypothetical protein
MLVHLIANQRVLFNSKSLLRFFIAVRQLSVVVVEEISMELI